jgi:hypothetical protein
VVENVSLKAAKTHCCTGTGSGRIEHAGDVPRPVSGESADFGYLLRIVMARCRPEDDRGTDQIITVHDTDAKQMPPDGLVMPMPACDRGTLASPNFNGATRRPFGVTLSTVSVTFRR